MNEEPCHRKAAREQCGLEVKATTCTLSSAQFKWRWLDEHSNMDIRLLKYEEAHTKVKHDVWCDQQVSDTLAS